MPFARLSLNTKHLGNKNSFSLYFFSSFFCNSCMNRIDLFNLCNISIELLFLFLTSYISFIWSIINPIKCLLYLNEYISLKKSIILLSSSFINKNSNKSIFEVSI